MFDFDRLYQLSKACGVSKSHLCSLAGKNASYIADLRRLHREPLPQVVSAWADALHTTPAYLMGETDDPEIKKEPAAREGDELEKKLLAFYGEVKPYLDEDDIEDVKIFLQAKADRKRRKMENDKG